MLPATTYTKTISLLGAEVMALRNLIVVCHALASKLDDPFAQKELLVYVDVLEKVTNQLMR